MSFRDPHPEPNDDRDEDGFMSNETSERRVREVLGSVNDLEPPRDDLFVARAITKGRARTARRRSAQFGAAAVVLIAGGFGGTWLLGQSAGSTASSLAADAPARGDSAAASGEGAASPLPSGERSAPGLGAASPVSPSSTGPGGAGTRSKADDRSSGARDSSRWLQGTMTAQRIAFDTLASTLAARWPDVFSGAYAADAGNSRIVVTLVRPDPALESLVRKAMPSPDDVQFVTATNSLAAKEKVAADIRAGDGALRSDGVQVTGIRFDGRSDRVVVATTPGSTPGVLEKRYGAGLVTVEVDTSPPPVKLPNGSTLPTLQR